MKTKWNYRKTAIMIFAIITGFSFSACLDSGDDESSIYTDVITYKRIIDEEVKYASAYFTYSTQSLSSVSVEVPSSSETFDLEAYGSSSYVFMLEPDDADFSVDAPYEGSYVFTITSADDEVHESTDSQSFDDVGFAFIDSLVYDETTSSLFLQWEEAEGADSYVVKLLDSSGNIVFTGYSVDSDINYYYISITYTTGSWESSPDYGTDYTLRVQAIKYDNDATDDDYYYNIQEISFYDTTVTWELSGN